ncbi:MAG: rod shape-determining protein MreC [Rhodobacterales bacterium]|nr:MAG: rod shape-determining protein MreC [Rhodobacterales bacterium]
MAKTRRQSEDFVTPVRRILVGLLVFALFALFLLWRIDSPRVERFRAQVVDAVVPNMEWALVPVTRAVELVEGFQSYARLAEQNQELRRELQRMKAWKEAAVQLEEENARLLDLNNVRLDARLSYVTGRVLTDSGSPFRQSVLLNVGARDGLVDGWAAMDGLGLVGRISGVGQQTARVILLTDSSSRIPVTVQPSGQKALLSGDNTARPPLEFLDDREAVRPGDRVVSSGDGGVFPAGLLVGAVVAGADGRLRVQLAADYGRLEFLRVLRSHPGEAVTEAGGLIVMHPALAPVADGRAAVRPGGAAGAADQTTDQTTGQTADETTGQTTDETTGQTTGQTTDETTSGPGDTGDDE